MIAVLTLSPALGGVALFITVGDATAGLSASIQALTAAVEARSASEDRAAETFKSLILSFEPEAESSNVLPPLAVPVVAPPRADAWRHLALQRCGEDPTGVQARWRFFLRR